MIIDNKRVHDLIVEKDKLVGEGRNITRDITALENKVKVFEMKEKRITGKIVPSKEITDRGDAIAKQINKLNEDLRKIIKEIDDAKLSAIPKEMKEDHLALLKKKEEMERERNKIALKIQKIKDKIIPIIQKEVKPLLGEYDDIETAKTKDGKVVIETFNHLVEFKRKFGK